ncbi:MAG: hypothetical protein Q8Q87_02215 [Candidatus Omnitrophota bacterium]|nr:hypothetical protein [Candidatus Omnitrophota bacterium]
MRDKKFIALMVLSIFAVVSLMYGISARPKGRAERVYITTGGNSQILPQAAVPTQRRAKRSKFTSWKRSPFVPTGVPGTSSSLVLSGILSSGKGLKATIGDAIVGKGDKVGGNTVVDIKKDKVILNDGTKDFELKLNE